MRKKNLEVYQAAVKLAGSGKRATGKAFRKSSLRSDTTARLSF
jgi:hypothetical protein